MHNFTSIKNCLHFQNSSLCITIKFPGQRPPKNRKTFHDSIQNCHLKPTRKKKPKRSVPQVIVFHSNRVSLELFASFVEFASPEIIADLFPRKSRNFDSLRLGAIWRTFCIPSRYSPALCATQQETGIRIYSGPGARRTTNAPKVQAELNALKNENYNVKLFCSTRFWRENSQLKMFELCSWE